MADASHALPVLTGASLWVFGASVAGAAGLHCLRMYQGKETGRGQVFNDGGAIISLIVLLCMGWDMVRPSDFISDLVNDNAILVCWAVLYAAFMVALNLKDSVVSPKKKPASSTA